MRPIHFQPISTPAVQTGKDCLSEAPAVLCLQEPSGAPKLSPLNHSSNSPPPVPSGNVLWRKLDTLPTPRIVPIVALSPSSFTTLELYEYFSCSSRTTPLAGRNVRFLVLRCYLPPFRHWMTATATPLHLYSYPILTGPGEEKPC